MSDLKPFVDNQRARVIRPEQSRARTFFARRSEPLTARTDDRPSGYQRKVSVGAIGSSIVCSVPCFLFVSVWPGFLKRFGTAELLSVSSRARTPYALCAKPAWEKQPHLHDRVQKPRDGDGRLLTIGKLFQSCLFTSGCLWCEAASRHRDRAASCAGSNQLAPLGRKTG